jgi:ComEC/Rec2-related protein
LVCGKNLEEGKVKASLKQTGLLHLLVVSGSHLIFISEVLILFLPASLRFVVLFFFTLMTGVQAPIFRALMQQLVNQFQKKFRLNYSPLQVCLFTAIICLVLEPSWLMSLSFQLSSLASFALCINNYKKIQTQFCVGILLTPVIGSFHPLFVFSNLLFGTIVGSVLFPLSALAFLSDFAAQLFAHLWIYFTQIIQQFAAVNNHFSPLRPSALLTIYLLFVYCWALAYEPTLRLAEVSGKKARQIMQSNAAFQKISILKFLSHMLLISVIILMATYTK